MSKVYTYGNDRKFRDGDTLHFGVSLRVVATRQNNSTFDRSWTGPGQVTVLERDAQVGDDHYSRIAVNGEEINEGGVSRYKLHTIRLEILD